MILLYCVWLFSKYLFVFHWENGDIVAALSCTMSSCRLNKGLLAIFSELSIVQPWVGVPDNQPSSSAINMLQNKSFDWLIINDLKRIISPKIVALLMVIALAVSNAREGGKRSRQLCMIKFKNIILTIFTYFLFLDSFL